MSEPKYDEDLVNLGYLKKAVSDTEDNINKEYENVSRHYGSKPQPPYNKGDTWIDGDIVYVCIKSRQIGTYEDSDWVTESGAKKEAEKKNKVFLRQPSNYSAGDMWILQSDNDHKAGKKGEMLISTAGRAEYDEGDWINMLGYGTTRSINEVADNLNNAINRIGDVEEAIEDGIIITFYQDSEPEAKHIGDLWYVTGEVEGYTQGKLYRYDGAEWKILDDPAIQKAFDEANEARIVADGKIQSFYSDTEPTKGVGVGDLWIDLANNNQLYRYNGTKWVAVYDTRINELVVNVESVTERVTTVETDLGEIDLKVKETTTTVTTIQGDVNDMQDNIVSLQAQIDGSIQFWNGSDIPTINNYPANEWTTEEEKNKHRADIYTVIEDIDGELKQGKSYRFDKVGDKWQWIELTDNELSAVQALAQSKAKVFVTTPTVPYNVGDLWLNNGKLLECQTAKDANGSYSANDWKEAVNYTDDTVANLAKTLANNAQSTADSAVEGVTNITNTRGQAEGKNIHLTDSAEEPLVDISLHGETNQATRSGKNKFDRNKIITSGGTSLNDTGINLSNCWATTVMANENVLKDFKPNTAYTCTAKVKCVSKPTTLKDGTNHERILLLYNSNTTAHSQNKSVLADANKNSWLAGNTYKCRTVFVTPEDLTGFNLLSYNYYGNNDGSTTYAGSGEFEITELMIQEGDVTDEEFELYGASPSPEFPSEIENVEGKNLFDKSAAVLGYINDANGNLLSSATRYASNYIEINPNTNYYITVQTSGNWGAWYDENKTYISGITGYGAVVSPSNAKYVRLTIINSTSLETMQLEKGTVATEYVPYNSLAVKVTGKNLFNNNFDDYIRPTDYYVYPITLEKGKVYRFNTSLIGTAVTGIVVGIVKDGTRYSEFSSLLIQSINTTGGINNPSFMIDDTWVSPKLVVYATTQALFEQIFENYNVQLVEGTEILDYEPYQEQTAYFPLAEGQKLMEGSYLAEDGIHNTRKQIVLDGTENWTAYTDMGNVARAYFVTPGVKLKASILCDKLVSSPLYETDEEGIGTNPYGTSLLVIKLNKTRLSSEDIAGIKAWLTENPITVEYELAEEEIVPYTAEQQEAWNSIRALTTYKNVTNISSDAYAKIVYMRDNGLDIYETKQNADKRYTETTEKLAETKITTDSIKDTVSETEKRLTNDYLTAEQVNAEISGTKEDIDILKQKQASTELTAEGLQIQIDTINNEGVNKVKTSMGYTFGDEGMIINKENADTGTIVDEAGFRVLDKTGTDEQNLLYAGYVKEGDTSYPDYIGQTIVATANLIVQNYLVVGSNSRFEDYVNPELGGEGTGVFEI